MNIFKIRLILFLLSIYLTDTVYSQELDKNQRNWIKIDSIFKNIEENPNLKKRCYIQYKRETAPHVDLWDAKSDLILSDISKSHALIILNYYSEFCAKCDSNILNTKFLDSLRLDLSEDLYSIEINYKVIENKTVDIISIIYNNEKYLLFLMGYVKKN